MNAMENAAIMIHSAVTAWIVTQNIEVDESLESLLLSANNLKYDILYG